MTRAGRLGERRLVTVARVRRIGVLVVVGVCALAACAGDDDAATTSAAPESAAAPATSAAPESAAAPATSAPPATSAAPGTPRSYDFSEVDELVDRFVETRGLNGASLVVVERDDGIVHERYWGEFDADRVSLIASSSKMVTAGVLMHLDDLGLVDVDAPVADAVEWGTGNPDITPAQLVSNSSGLVGLFPAVVYGPYVCQFLIDGTIEECATQIFTTPDDDDDVVPPDTEFRYGGGQWQVVGGLAEAVSGKRWDELFAEAFVEPCGLTSIGYTNPFLQFGNAPTLSHPDEFGSDPGSLEPTDNPNMEAGVYTNARDYATLLLMHLREGMCGDTRVLSAEGTARLQADRIGPAFDGRTPAGGGYGMGWWVDRGTGIITDAGAYGSYPFLDVDDGIGAMLILEADGGAGDSLGTQLTAPIIEAVIAARSAPG